jgi:hypothetical protein
VLSVAVTRNESPVMLKTGDCLSPLPLVVLTTLAPRKRGWPREFAS